MKVVLTSAVIQVKVAGLSAISRYRELTQPKLSKLKSKIVEANYNL